MRVVAAKALSGGIVGAAAATTGGLSLVAQGLRVGGGGLLGGVAERHVDGIQSTMPLDADALIVDAASSGAAGVAGGVLANKVRDAVLPVAATRIILSGGNAKSAARGASSVAGIASEKAAGMARGATNATLDRTAKLILDGDKGDE